MRDFLVKQNCVFAEMITVVVSWVGVLSLLAVVGGATANILSRGGRMNERV